MPVKTYHQEYRRPPNPQALPPEASFHALRVSRRLRRDCEIIFSSFRGPCD